MTTERPFNLRCLLRADTPDELARVLRQIANQVDVERDNIERDRDRLGDRGLVLDVVGDAGSDLAVRVSQLRPARSTPAQV